MIDATAISKKQQLVDAAASLFHEQGVTATTLAEVASAAKVALGSVYYYFKTKDDLVASVVARREDGVARLIAGKDGASGPRERLMALVKVWVEDRDADAQFGCPVGSLCFEVARARGPLSAKAARPFELLLGWCEKQFRELGAPQSPDRCALHLVSALQGISLTAAVFGDPKLILKEADYLLEWLRVM